MIPAPLMGAINKTDTQTLKEMLTTLGPLTQIINKLLYILEKITNKFQNKKTHI